MSLSIYYDKDADLELISSKKIKIIGYGSQGHAHAANLRDSGVQNICVALAKNSKSIHKAEDANFKELLVYRI